MLEVEEENIGNEVECGECLEVFVAWEKEEKSEVREKPSTRKRPSARPEKKRSKRRWDDEDEDDDDYPSRSSGGSSGAAVAGLVFGIISIPLGFCCSIFGSPFAIAAIVLGSISRKHKGSSGTAIAALSTGVIGLLLSIGMLILGLILNGANLMNQPWRGR
jgi:hypothetical protein